LGPCNELPDLEEEGDAEGDKAQGDEDTIEASIYHFKYFIQASGPSEKNED